MVWDPKHCGFCQGMTLQNIILFILTIYQCIGERKIRYCHCQIWKWESGDWVCISTHCWFVLQKGSYNTENSVYLERELTLETGFVRRFSRSTEILEKCQIYWEIYIYKYWLSKKENIFLLSSCFFKLTSLFLKRINDSSVERNPVASRNIFLTVLSSVDCKKSEPIYNCIGMSIPVQIWITDYKKTEDQKERFF